MTPFSYELSTNVIQFAHLCQTGSFGTYIRLFSICLWCKQLVIGFFHLFVSIAKSSVLSLMNNFNQCIEKVLQEIFSGYILSNSGDLHSHSFASCEVCMPIHLLC